MRFLYRTIPHYTTLFHGIVCCCFKKKVKIRTSYTILSQDFSRHQRMLTHLVLLRHFQGFLKFTYTQFYLQHREYVSSMSSEKK